MKRIKNLAFVGLIALQFLFLSTDTFARKIYSNQTGDWSSTTTWIGSLVPVANDTIIIKAGHTVSVTANLYSNSTYVFLIIVGTLDLTSNGKLSFDDTAKVIIETGGRILGNGSNDQISIGTGGAEYTGGQGNVTGPSYVSNGHSPTTGEGTGGCGCYTPGTIPLPVKLVGFEAALENGVVALSWTTIMEKDFSHFIVERSTNGKDFYPLGERKGAGFNVEDIENHYSFDDRAALIGYNYYRLKAVDLDNTFEYFGVESILVQQGKKVSLYPNPAPGNSINVVLNFQPSENEMIYVYDNLGVKLEEFSISEFENRLDFTNTLNQGNYLLKYASASHEQIIRFTVK